MVPPCTVRLSDLLNMNYDSNADTASALGSLADTKLEIAMLFNAVVD